MGGRKRATKVWLWSRQMRLLVATSDPTCRPPPCWLYFCSMFWHRHSSAEIRKHFSGSYGFHHSRSNSNASSTGYLAVVSERVCVEYIYVLIVGNGCRRVLDVRNPCGIISSYFLTFLWKCLFCHLFATSLRRCQLKVQLGHGIQHQCICSPNWNSSNLWKNHPLVANYNNQVNLYFILA